MLAHGLMTDDTLEALMRQLAANHAFKLSGDMVAAKLRTWSPLNGLSVGTFVYTYNLLRSSLSRAPRAWFSAILRYN